MSSIYSSLENIYGSTNLFKYVSVHWWKVLKENFNCIICFSTELKFSYDLEDSTYQAMCSNC